MYYMYRELVVSVLFLAALNSYFEVDKNFGPNSYCDKSINYNITMLNKEKEYFSKMCSLSQSEYEKAIDEFLESIPKHDFQLQNIVNLHNSPDFKTISCYDYQKLSYVKNQVEYKVVSSLEDKSIYFKYFYYFMKTINFILEFFGLLFSVLILSLHFGVNLIIFKFAEILL